MQKITDKTIEILKNFSTINNGLVFNKGKVQSTIADDGCILAEATLDEEFPVKFGVYDMSNFLSNLSLLKNPTMKFSDNNTVIISDNDGFSLEYRGCPADLIKSPPEDADLTISVPDAKIKLTELQLQKLLRVANVNEFVHFMIIGKGGKLKVKIHDRKNDSSNSGMGDLGEYVGDDFEAVFKTEKLKMLPKDYNVSIKKDAYALFESIDGTIKYFIAFEMEEK